MLGVRKGVGQMRIMEEDDFIDISFMLNPGVYALVFNGEVVYIGMSTRLLGRFREHINKVPFSQVYIKFCAADAVSELEAELIAKYRPKYNRLFPGQLKDNLNYETPNKPKSEKLRAIRKMPRHAAENVARWVHARDGTIEMSDDEEVRDFVVRRKSE
jgi:hypothetical protein